MDRERAKMKSDQVKFLLAGARNRGKKFTSTPPPPPSRSRFFSRAPLRTDLRSETEKARRKLFTFLVASPPPLSPFSFSRWTSKSFRREQFDLPLSPAKFPSPSPLPAEKDGLEGGRGGGVGAEGGKSSFFFVGTFL